ncbi:carbohydrate ABC transporter permease [Gloeobacter kilaueensis]|uniref:Binding-protein-dependent transport systems inner membrane component n=1 Tax=Gloeobacter kilaueensis (strain ATCC BAA-2537 / CCAP 1431/1 / ULC 316 / JS1) TaxID=1183438 RepID=U5QJE7_GLOK1|nr:carbohydrate ABC transporter permease [Gloeobacter kilaueensis]AGY57744.1 binding-protein-dependent transport systems inner membrane component [Gloeobacter kilaueensis JS1]
MNWRTLSWLVVLLGAVTIVLPLGLVVVGSLQPGGLVTGLAPGRWNLANYRAAWAGANFPLAFALTTLVALAVTALQIVTSALAGYALARLDFRGRQGVLLLVLATIVIPYQVLVVPIFLVLRTGGLVNSFWALVLPTAANGYGIYLLRQFFLGVPRALEEAAFIDGANRLQVLWEVLLPLSRPALVTLGLFTFIAEWNDLFKPLVFAPAGNLLTVQLALSRFQERFATDFSVLMAATVISSLPVVALFLLGQRQLVRGIATTGLKN